MRLLRRLVAMNCARMVLRVFPMWFLALVFAGGVTFVACSTRVITVMWLRRSVCFCVVLTRVLGDRPVLPVALWQIVSCCLCAGFSCGGVVRDVGLLVAAGSQEAACGQ